VRELRNAIERAVVLGRGEWIEEGDLPPNLGGRVQPTQRRSATPTPPLGSMAISNPAITPPAPSISAAASEPPREREPSREPSREIEEPAAVPPGITAKSLRELEREGIIAALAATSGNKAQAAAILEIDRSTLYKKLKEYGIG
jgi:DNA-binding NtrC family response regulator